MHIINYEILDKRNKVNHLSHPKLTNARATRENKHDSPSRSLTLSITSRDRSENDEIIICINKNMSTLRFGW
jgi:hypothetical protein